MALTMPGLRRAVRTDVLTGRLRTEEGTPGLPRRHFKMAELRTTTAGRRIQLRLNAYG